MLTYWTLTFAIFGLATDLANFSKNWAVLFQSSDHTEHWLAYFATVVSYGRKFYDICKKGLSY
jgi:hypothetical protein